MASDGHIRFEIADRVATVTIDRPAKRNALSMAMRGELLDLLRRADADRQVRVIIVTGADGAFCAGGDIGVLEDLKKRNDETGFVRLLDEGMTIVRLLRMTPKPTIAMVNGPAYGAGFFIALACDLRFCAESASFGAPFVRLGLGPDWGGTWLLPRLIGTALTLEMLFTGDGIDASEALRLGLANHIWPDDQLRERAYDFAHKLCDKPPAVLARHKQAVHAAIDGSLADIADLERRLQLENFRSDDFAEGIAAFRDKRPPRFDVA